jgi:sugar O-acyltransferase (sialic acid O-acetyltransferase NeuD family)
MRISVALAFDLLHSTVIVGVTVRQQATVPRREDADWHVRDREMQDLLLFPCNGNAMEALDCLGDEFRGIGFVDDSPGKIGTTVFGLPVWNRSALSEFPDAKVLAVPGSPDSFPRRGELIASLEIPRARLAAVVHPKAMVSRNASIGANVLLMAGVVITANAVIEDHVVILPNSVVHHDSRIGAYTMVGAGVVVAGCVHIGAHCYIGSGSRFRNNLTIAPGTLVGLGSTVVKPIGEASGVWAGTPARFVRQLAG